MAIIHGPRKYPVILDDILSHPLMKQCPVARDAIQSTCLDDAPSDFLVPWWSNIWFAIGQLFQSWSDREKRVSEVDAESSSPRRFATGDMSEGRISNQILAAQEAFEPNSNLQPAHVPLLLSNTIEMLTRSIWPAQVSNLENKRQFSLVAFLQERQRSVNSDDVQKRFAHIALTLYKGYRNPAQHKGESFEASYQEMRFYFEGIRTLRDLASRLNAKIP